jgi:phosphatidylglycerophosphate synthase
MMAVLADVLTLSRIAAAGILIWLGIAVGAPGLPVAALVTVLGWTTDQLDGWVARHSAAPTYLKDYDFQVDVIFYIGILAYLATAHFLPSWLVLGFAAVGIVAWLLTRRKAVGIIFLRIIDGAYGVIILVNAPAIGLAMLVWLAVLAAIYRRRLAERVPRWFRDLQNVRH